MQNILSKDNLLSPEEEVTLLGKKEISLTEIVARLDVDACRFGSSVDAQGVKPCVETGFQGFGNPISGRLVFSPEKISSFHEKGQKAILVLKARSESLIESNPFKPDGHICICDEKIIDGSERDDHFLGGTSYWGTVLLDNIGHPRLKWNKNENHLVLKDGSRFYEGDEVTIDPVTGRIWRGALPILPPPDYTAKLHEIVQTSINQDNTTSIGCNFSTYSDYLYLEKVNDGFSLFKAAIFWRTEGDLLALCSQKKDIGTNIFAQLLAGSNPTELESWEHNNIRRLFSMQYRLVDIHSFTYYLPNYIVDELKDGNDHIKGTESFKLRERLYRLQLKKFINQRNQNSLKNFHEFSKTIIIPSITNAEEVSFFKKLVMEELDRVNLSHVVRFGVMIETEEALENIAEISLLCDSLCVGFNDLTASVMKKSRSQLDYPGWMVLMPKVIDDTKKALRIARGIKPDIFINTAGYQIGGHDIASIDAVLAMGVDQITVPPNFENVMRTQLAIMRYNARQEIGLPQRTPRAKSRGFKNCAVLSV